MPKSCIVCNAFASQYCDACQSAMYCSKACQRKDWKKQQHKQLCKLLNVGHGDRQVRTDFHTKLCIRTNARFESEERILDEGAKSFFKLFEESTSTFEGSQAAAQRMKNIAKRQSKNYQNFLFFHSLYYLIHSDSETLSWPNSPLLVMLQFVDPNVLSGVEDAPLLEGGYPIPRETPLFHLADLAHSFDYSTHENQLILAKQLIQHSANVNTVSFPHGRTPLHKACYGAVVTNLDLVELLLQEGANPNAQDDLGRTPLMYTTPDAPGAAKYLLNWPTTNASVTSQSGASFLARVRSLNSDLSDQLVLLHDDPDRVQRQFAIQQWLDIEKLLVERGAADTGITTF
jgi:hypothetical protein